MGKLYRTDEICEVIDNKLDLIGKDIVRSCELNGEELLKEVTDYRSLKEALYSLVDDLKAADAAYDAEMAAWRASQEEKKNGTDA